MSKALLESALDLAARGMRVFPLVPGTKRPALDAWPDLATTDPDQIQKVWGNGRDWNIGVAMGGGFIGFDVDVKNGKPGLASAASLGVALEGLVVRTPSGGKHVYFRGPDVRNSAGRLGDGLDIRGAGGYLVGPGSVVDGQAYVVEASGEIGEAPTVLLVQIGAGSDHRVRAAHPVIPQDQPDAVARGVAYLGSEAGLACEGQSGDHTTFVVAARLKDFGVSQDMAVELMAEHWNDRCSPPWDLEDLKTKVRNAYAYGSLQPGSLHPAFEFAEIKIEGPPPVTVEPSRWFRHGEQVELNTSWLFYETLPATGVAVMVAPTGAGKTFLALELARSLATGKEWFTVTPDDLGGTLFVFAGTEGSGFAHRLAALGEEEVLPISATSCGNLADRGALDGLLEALKAEAARVLAQHGVPVRLVVLETLAASGLINDENDNSEASRAFANLAQISRAMNALVITSHHPDKKGNEARGASAIPSSVDAMITVRRDGKGAVRDVELSKMRNAEERRLGSFTLLRTVLGEDKRGREITSMSVSMGAPSTLASRAAPHYEAFLEALDWAWDESLTQCEGRTSVSIDRAMEVFGERKSGRVTKAELKRQFDAALTHAEGVGTVDVAPCDGTRHIMKKEISIG